MASPEDKDDLLWIMAGSALVILSLIWYSWVNYGHRITNFSIFLTLGAMNINAAMHKILPDIEALRIVAFFFIPEEFLYEKTSIEKILRDVDPFKPSLEDLKFIWTLLGYIVRYPIIVYGMFLSWKMFEMTRPLRLKRRFNIFSLARLNMVNSPHIRHAIQKEIHKEPYNKGIHRQEEGCIRFAILNDAVRYVDENGVEFKIKLSNIHSIDETQGIFYVQDSYDEDEGLPLIHNRCILNLPNIQKPFKEQITQCGVWNGFDELPRHAKAIAAVFLYFIKGGKQNNKTAINLLRRYNLSYTEKTKKKPWGIDDSGIQEIIEEMSNANAVKNITKKHYYNITILVGLYNKASARRTKIPPNLFYWIKEVDRGLWYALHQNLSPASWCEAAGVRSIELVENKLKNPCSFAYVDSAVKAIVTYLDDEGWFLKYPENLKEISG